MTFFPQFQPGALAQYPLSRRTVHRTAHNAHADGRAVKLGDPDWTHLIWQLTYRGLTDEEKNALEQLFAAVEGRLGSFSFLDPWANLLGWSEELSNAAWAKGRHIECTSRAVDPFGGLRATTLRNTGSQPDAISQIVAVPAWYRHCFSVFVRAEQESNVALFRIAGSERAGSICRVEPAWRRVQHSAAMQTQAEPTQFGIELQPGSQVTVFGFQLESQLRAGPYRKTTSDAGIYPDAAFEDDVLDEIAEAPGRHRIAVRVRARRQAGS